MRINFNKKVSRIIEKDSRYKADAYEFVMLALSHTQKDLSRKGHVSGGELLKGIRRFGMDQFGPMTKTVFNSWGVEKTADFGAIVFNMIDHGLMSKNEEDSPNDFKDVYDFNKDLNVFDSNFRLEKKNENKDILS
ncbi:MAG: hypothetical protein NTY47_00270 [Candidatus Omnitrophica bacterium]|nr:hypothetical protein [Candidatus Omnitrophota bacterium]